MTPPMLISELPSPQLNVLQRKKFNYSSQTSLRNIASPLSNLNSHLNANEQFIVTNTLPPAQKALHSKPVVSFAKYSQSSPYMKNFGKAKGSHQALMFQIVKEKQPQKLIVNQKTKLPTTLPSNQPQAAAKTYWSSHVNQNKQSGSLKTIANTQYPQERDYGQAEKRFSISDGGSTEGIISNKGDDYPTVVIEETKHEDPIKVKFNIKTKTKRNIVLQKPQYLDFLKKDAKQKSQGVTPKVDQELQSPGDSLINDHQIPSGETTPFENRGGSRQRNPVVKSQFSNLLDGYNQNLDKKSKFRLQGSNQNGLTSLQEIQKFIRNDLYQVTPEFYLNNYYANNYTFKKEEPQALNSNQPIDINQKVHLKSLITDQIKELEMLKEKELLYENQIKSKEKTMTNFDKIRGAIIEGLMRRIREVKQQQEVIQDQIKKAQENEQNTDDDLLRCMELSNFSSTSFEMKNHPFFQKYKAFLEQKLMDDLSLKSAKPNEILQKAENKSEEIINKVKSFQINPRYIINKKKLDLHDVSTPQHSRSPSESFISRYEKPLLSASKHHRSLSSLLSKYLGEQMPQKAPNSRSEFRKSQIIQQPKKQERQQSEKIVLDCISDVFHQKRIRKLKLFASKDS